MGDLVALKGRFSSQGDPHVVSLGRWFAVPDWRHRPWHEERGQERPGGYDDPCRPIAVRTGRYQADEQWA